MLQLHWLLPIACLVIGLGIFDRGAARGADEGVPAAQPADVQPADVQPERPLHQRIDQLVEAAAIGPLTPACSDADFLRRVCLDLTGVIPTAHRVREFLADPAPDKRQRLIDQLLASPEFVRHMAVRWDVMLLERQTGSHIPVPDWESYLLQSVADGKPLDQLFRELIIADRLGPEVQPATKFLINRLAEPHAVTRDIGRLAFGMDLQCAQCHDHPLIDDYYQADYYGLFAFLHRTSLLTAPKPQLSEQAVGEVNFESVFTGDGRDRVFPQLPKGKSLFVEPTFAAGEEFTTKPEEGVAGVPKHSRREALATMLADSRQFQRNLANRVWALVFGRGIVHPVDFHHLANPPQNPALLDLLADELVAHGFELRWLVRELVLTRVYQRACDAPRPETVNFADIAARGERLALEHEAALAAIDPLREELAEAETALDQSLAENQALAGKLPALESAVSEAKQILETSLAAQHVAAERLARVKDQSQAVAAAAAQTAAAVAKLPDDKPLAAAAATILARAEELATAVQEATTGAAAGAAQAETAAKAVAAAEAALAAATGSQVEPDALAKLEQTRLAAAARLTAAEYASRAVAAQAALCRDAAEYAAVAETDPAKAEAIWKSLVERWTIAGQIAPLRPLTPEQLAASALRATGMLAPQIAAVEAKIEKTPPDVLKAASDSDKPQLQSRLVQQELLNQLRGTVNQFVSHYGGLPGEDFQATVNQALFFGNSPVVAGWLQPAGDNLASRLAKIEDPAALADELAISVLSRPAQEREKQGIAELLAESQERRPEAIREFIWAMLSSTEFRFNH